MGLPGVESDDERRHAPSAGTMSSRRARSAATRTVSPPRSVPRESRKGNRSPDCGLEGIREIDHGGLIVPEGDSRGQTPPRHMRGSGSVDRRFRSVGSVASTIWSSGCTRGDEEQVAHEVHILGTDSEGSRSSGWPGFRPHTHEFLERVGHERNRVLHRDGPRVRAAGVRGERAQSGSTRRRASHQRPSPTITVFEPTTATWKARSGAAASREEWARRDPRRRRPETTEDDEIRRPCAASTADRARRRPASWEECQPGSSPTRRSGTRGVLPSSRQHRHSLPRSRPDEPAGTACGGTAIGASMSRTSIALRPTSTGSFAVITSASRRSRVPTSVTGRLLFQRLHRIRRACLQHRSA